MILQRSEETTQGYKNPNQMWHRSLSVLFRQGQATLPMTYVISEPMYVRHPVRKLCAAGWEKCEANSRTDSDWETAAFRARSE
ncbi:MAG: hypothetical protein C4K47_04330 [Candidatus Thorarchaeota archaeon]|nr:MAG: hypothetical protein C4K47_04330 [Candidatus Thorarchaeota archaeon]